MGEGAGAGAGAGAAVAVPESADVTVPADVATDSVALRDPAAAGVKDTMIVHDEDAATVPPGEHVPPVTVKSPLFVPEMVIPPLLMVIDAVPELLTVTVAVPAPDPTVREAKDVVVGLISGEAAWKVFVEAIPAGTVELPL